MIDLAGRVALVTGGSRGIGRACCETLARAGAKVAVIYRVERPWAELVANAIREAGGDAFELGADVSRREDSEMMVDETVDRFGRLDIVVNSAGIWTASAVDELSDNEWNETVSVNLTGTFNVIRAAVPTMKERLSGRIINISSTAGQRGEALHSHYAATKGAVQSLTKSLAVELAPHGITVNCVAPGWVETDMTRDTLNGPDGDAIRAGIPLGRAGNPEEVAGAVRFIIENDFYSGQILGLDGGLTL